MLLIGAGIAIDRFDLFSDLTFAIQRTPSRMPSTRFVPESDLRTGVPILSLATQDEALNSPYAEDQASAPDAEAFAPDAHVPHEACET